VDGTPLGKELIVGAKKGVSWKKNKKKKQTRKAGTDNWGAGGMRRSHEKGLHKSVAPLLRGGQTRRGEKK